MKRVIVTSLFLFLSIYAKWQNPTPIYVGPGDQTIDMVISDGAGGAAVLWHDSQTGWEFMNVIDSAGNLKWGSGGLAVLMMGDTLTQNPDLFLDDDGNYWVALEAHWYTPSEGQDIYVQKISPTGQRLFGDKGVAVCTAMDVQDWPLLCSSNEGIIIVWKDWRFKNDSDKVLVLAQRLGKYGTFLWNEDGLQVTDCPDGQTQSVGDIVTDNNAGAIVIHRQWIDGNFVIAQRLDSSGTRLWGNSGKNIAAGDFYKGSLFPPAGDAISDEAGGCIFFYWERPASILAGRYVTQRLDSSGNLLWNPSGIDIPSFSTYSPLSDSGLYLSRCGTMLYQSMSVYAHRLTLDGETPLGDTGISVWKVDAMEPNGSILPHICENGILVWRDVDDDSNWYNERGLLAQRVDTMGNILWPEEVVIAGPEDIVHPGVVPLVKGHFPRIVSTFDNAGIVIWESNKNGNLDIKATRIDSLGNLPPGIEEQPVLRSPAKLLVSSCIASGDVLLHYSLSPGEPGTLKLFDASGRMVSSLSVRGQGEVKVAGLSAGVYFARLEAVGASVTKKIVVVR